MSNLYKSNRVKMISYNIKLFWIIFLIIFSNLSLQAQAANTPKVELRGAWIATVNNIDFPKKPSPNSVAQKSNGANWWKNLKR
ncbi:MAG: hypothetical protein HC892_07050 [Saprospiraceae bacterium]|nr:hypothetical protein [Saprospiraceae bacterium]